MRYVICICLSFFIAQDDWAQIVRGTVEIARSCSMFGESVPKNVTLFESEAEAEGVIKQIVSASGLSKNFEIRAAGVPNAAAVIQGQTRYILYEPYFMRSVRQQTGTKWAGVSIMAHEIGHHLNGHTLSQEGSRPDKELEADYFSGFVLQKLGASIGEARKGMETFGSPSGTATHPARNDRLVAITQGWNSACSKDSSCVAAERTPERAKQRQADRTEVQDDEEPAPKKSRRTRTRPVDPDSTASRGYGSGTPTSACGCWGAAMSGATEPNPSCASGYHMALQCQGWCQMGGSPWRTVCR